MFVETKREGEAPAETAAPTLRGLIAWLEKQDPGEVYDFLNPRACAFGQYCLSINHDPPQWLDRAAMKMGEPRHTLSIIGSGFPRTFGGALERAREIDG